MTFQPRLVRAAGMATALAAAALVHAVAAPPSDWAQWRGPNRDGVAPCTDWSPEGKELWRADVGRGYSGVCLRDGNLLTLGFDAATEQDVLVCLDPLTGAERWRHAYASRLNDNMHEGGTLTTPVAKGDRVYLLSRLGTITCLELGNGAVAWQRDLKAELDLDIGAFGLPASPLLLEDGLVLNVGPTMLLDEATGATHWQTRDYGYSYAVPVDSTVGGMPTLVVFNAAGLVTLDRSTGEERSVFPWTSQYNVNSATPIVIGDRVFISTGYNDKGCAMLDLSSGKPVVAWSSRLMSSKMNGCVLFDDHLYGFDDKVLRCLDLDGNERWSERGLGLGTVLVAADGRLVVLSEDGELVVAEGGSTEFRVLSRMRVFESGRCWTTPVLSDGLIYCRNNRGELVCMDHRTPAAAGDG